MRDAVTPSAPDAADRRLFIRVAGLGFLLFLAAWTVTPQIGPVFRIFTMSNAHMEPNIQRGRLVWANRLAYGLSRHSYEWVRLPITGRWPGNLMPMRGDVVMFKTESGQDWILRVIGLPRDRVLLDSNRLWLNGDRVRREVMADHPRTPWNVVPNSALIREFIPDGRSFAHFEAPVFDEVAATTEEFDVPAGHVFLLADNRDSAIDSRTIGFVPIERIVGRVESVYDR